MMEIELPKMSQSQQEMELIDILWRQDIDLGAGREVFDYSHRQKEDALRRQREREEEEHQRRLREQEKALLAELQLDEETGEFVPRTMPISQPGAATTAATPPEATQTDIFTEEDVDTLSFDECLQLLEESFPLVEPIETTSPTLDPSLTPASARAPSMMGPQQPALLPAAPSTQKSQSDLEQAWMELLSIPELQQCLNMQIGEVLEPAAYPSTIVPTSLQDPNYSFYMPKLTDVVPAPAETACSPGYQNTFEGTFSTAIPPDSLSQVTEDSSGLSAGFNIDSFCDMFYPEVSGASVSHSSPLTGSESVGSPAGQVPDEPPIKAMEVAEFALGEGFEGRKPEVTAEFPDSDSGLSLDSSPNNSSPAKSAFGDGSFGYSDSDTDKMDSSPGSVHSDYAETLSSSFGTDGFLENCDSPASQSGASQEPDVRHPKTEPTAGTGHSRPPFTKDKHRRRAESRLSRDEQRAKALRIPFTVELIINLPVDDFNEMMSKQQLSEAQLALVRDIRRRGKNKVAAQNCRKRKMESIAGLEQELDSLREDKERLLREHSENDSSLRQAKQQLSTLYQEVFGMLRDEHGRAYSPSEYSLQQTSDGNIYLVPRTKKAPSNSALGN